MQTDNTITRLLHEFRAGDRAALDRLLPMVYAELRQLAQRQLGRSRDGHTLDTTALVHEAYLKLADQSRLVAVDRAHFFGIAARAMRQILVDNARKHATLKRGRRWRRVPFDEDAMRRDPRDLGPGEKTNESQAEALLALEAALTRLSELNERLARVVECRFFGGMTESETGAALGLSERTVRRDWLKARLWLYGELAEEETG